MKPVDLACEYAVNPLGVEIYDARLELAGWSEAVTFDVGSGSYAFTLKGVAEADGGA